MSRKREFGRYLWDAFADVPYRSKCRFHRRSKSGALPASPEDSEYRDSECSSEGSGNGELALLNNVSTTADELQEPPALSRELEECALGGTENEPEETEEGDLATGSEGSSDSESDGADSHLRSDSKIQDDELEIYSGERGSIQTAKQAQCSHSRKEEAIVARRLEGSEILKTTSIKKVNSAGSGDWCHSMLSYLLQINYINISVCAINGQTTLHYRLVDLQHGQLALRPCGYLPHGMRYKCAKGVAVIFSSQPLATF
ncbi:hypothetical protein V5799_026100 [Amblyomma americanum]|uniref:Uncharacterized protein n=1 Tax=Amblyomma americanum TaxID=6943 RepID=A0AAQ4DJJ3_AMBAM